MSRFIFQPRTFLILALGALVISLPLAVPETALAKERRTVTTGRDTGVTLPGGGGGGVTGPVDGDPIDSNDYSPGDLFDPFIDPSYHETLDRGFYTTGSVVTPTFTIDGKWGVYLVFDRFCGTAIPSLRLYRLGSSGEE